MSDRLNLLTTWLTSHFFNDAYDIKPLSGDASFRRYFRVKTAEASYIVMDAPPEKENAHYFATMARWLKKQGARVPHVFAENQTQGFLLLSDFGDAQLLSQLTDQSADALYQQAINTLTQWQAMPTLAEISIPLFDQTRYHYEWQLFLEWFLPMYCQISITSAEKNQLDAVYQQVVSAAMAQPHVLVHRDYHSRNLMVCDDGGLGILDFQDAVIGPVTYDLVSLLRDCYISWKPEQVKQWARYYYDTETTIVPRSVSFDLFLQWVDWMGLQRHLKCLGIFSRLAFRDGKKGYLADIPRVLGYVDHVCRRYDAFYWLADFLSQVTVGVVVGTLASNVSNAS